MTSGRKTNGSGEGAQAWERVRAAARAGKRHPVYAFVGERFFVERAARELIEVVVPPAERAWNVERYDGQTVSWTAVIDSLRTPGFGHATKVVWVAGAAVLAGAEKQGDPASEVCEEWARGRKMEAAEKLLRLAASAGWRQERFDGVTWDRLPDALQRELFGRALDAAEHRQVTWVGAYCREKGLRIPAGKDAVEEELTAVLSGGLAPGVTLLLTAPTANTRSRLWRTIQEVGVGLVFAAPRERNQALSREGVETIAGPIVRAYGKTISRPAFELLVQRAGTEATRFAREVEKVCLWVGDRARIEPGDVVAATTDLAESWVFDFSGAMSRRSLAEALSKLDDLLRRGEPPLRLLALVAREMRQLAMAREILEKDLRPRIPGAVDELARTPNYANFQKRILPHLARERLDMFGGAHPFALFRRFQDALAWSARELAQVLVDLAELDRELKSSRVEARTLFERFLFRWCARPHAPTARG